MNLNFERCDPVDREEEIKSVKRTALKDSGAWDPEYVEEPEYGEFECFLVGRKGEEIVATGGYRPSGEIPNNILSIDGRAAELKNIHVRPEYQRNGIATEIVEKLEEDAEGRGFDEIVLHTTSIQEAAQQFYENIGYSQAESLCFTWEGNEHELVFYRKSL